MFDFRKLTAFFGRKPTAYEQAVRDIALGRYDRAITALDVLLEGAATPAERAKILNKRGVALVKAGRRDDARASFASALAARPQFAPALVNEGNLAFEEGDVSRAVALYESAIRCDDSYSVAHLNLGVAYKRLGRRGDAVREFRRANRLEGVGFFPTGLRKGKP
ncbi:MAG: tetratricopeptide repeat protein [Candidatus Eremiobacteraeota bacterium]|nr:tetratricopeptide repeat protein [Candidatus Eremiobacteraeota bacterium]